MCGETDRRLLRRVRLSAERAVLCANHAAIAGQRRPTLEGLRLECYPSGDRRQLERRSGDRRGQERRAAWTAAWEVAGVDRRRSCRRAYSSPGIV